MKNILGDHAFPDTEEDFIVLIEQTYKKLTGKSIKERDDVFIERYSHGGMLSGRISPQFWTKKALPMLLGRYRETKYRSAVGSVVQPKNLL